VKIVAKRKEEGITQNVDIIQEEDTTGIAVIVDVVAAVEAIVNAIVPVVIMEDIPVGMEKVHGEDLHLKRRKEKSLRSTRKN